MSMLHLKSTEQHFDIFSNSKLLDMKNISNCPLSIGAPLKLYGAPYANFPWRNSMEISMDFSTRNASSKQKFYRF
jgi:hypothetical protein